VHDGDQQVACKECRKLLVRNPAAADALQQRRRDKNKARTRLRQAPELAELDALIAEKVTEHRHTRALLSMPGFGPVLAAEFLGATGGDLTVFETADRFAGVAGLAPAPRDSGRISGNHHRPRRYDRRLLRVFYLSGLSALRSCPASRGYYDRKRTEGKTHIQAMLSLARRRLNVLWAMLRDGTTYIRGPATVASLAA
jgi:transposase